MKSINVINYCKYFNKQNDVSTISHDELDQMGIEYFVEIIKNPDVIRPYFDFDELEINDQNDWNDFIDELDRLSEAFDSDYCIAGYTTDKALHEITGLKYYENIIGLPADKEAKRLSMHVVYYDVILVRPGELRGALPAQRPCLWIWATRSGQKLGLNMEIWLIFVKNLSWKFHWNRYIGKGSLMYFISHDIY